MITTAQKTLLHVAQHKLGLTRDQYEAVLYENAGVRSSNDLDNKSFDKVVRRFEELGFTNTARKPRWRRSRPAEPITPQQQALVATLYTELEWAAAARQAGFNKRVIRKPWPQTRAEANKVIEALKAMIERGGSGAK